MFLLRCIFWLGLALWQITLREGGDPDSWFAPRAEQGHPQKPANAPQAWAPAASPTTLTEGAAALCKANPARCLDAATAAAAWIAPDSGPSRNVRR